MTPQGIAEVLDILSRIGVLGIAALVIFGFLTERIVPRGRIEELKRQLDEERKANADALDRIDADLRRIEDRVRGP